MPKVNTFNRTHRLGGVLELIFMATGGSVCASVMKLLRRMLSAARLSTK